MSFCQKLSNITVIKISREEKKVTFFAKTRLV